MNLIIYFNIKQIIVGKIIKKWKIYLTVSYLIFNIRFTLAALQLTADKVLALTRRRVVHCGALRIRIPNRRYPTVSRGLTRYATSCCQEKTEP